MEIKNNPIIKWSLAGLTAFAAATFWFGGADHEHHDHHHHHDHDEDHELITLTPQQIAEAGIEMDTASPGFLSTEIKAPGKIAIHSDYIVHLVPKVSGIVLEAKKNIGERVKAGETLAVLHSREMAEAKAAYLAASKKENLKYTVLQREQKLYDKKVSSEHEYLTANHEYEEACIDLELSRQRLHAFGFTDEEIRNFESDPASQFAIYAIKAPFSGTVIKRHASPGEHLEADHEAFVIANLDFIWAELHVAPQDVSLLEEGQPVRLSSSHGKEGEAEIHFVSPVIDEETRSGHAIAVFKNSGEKWTPGTYVSALVETNQREKPLVINQEAIQKIDGQDCVFVNCDVGFAIRPIRKGQSDGRKTEVVSGLEQGECYACKNTFLLKAEHEKDEAEHEH